MTSVTVNLGAGNDVFVGSGNLSTITMTIDAGAGDDTITTPTAPTPSTAATAPT